ncbi:MAG: phage Gp37/Gp68 family protein [Gemmataceae bacterium]|nr:phage Gp37/Gp68 family protein [Gemmataceae bacterium]
MNRTNIEWTATHHPDGTVTPGLTSNPLQYRDRRTGNVVWACIKCSTGCANCYSEALAERYKRGSAFTAASMAHLEPFLDEDELRHILTARTVGKLPVSGSRCFLGDMTDVFGPWVPDELLDRLFAVMALRPDVTFQVLTKRPERMADYFATGPGLTRFSRIREQMYANPCALPVPDPFAHPYPGQVPWPLPNLWLGTSAENQAAADARIPHLLRVPARVRFLSCEPLLGPVDLRRWLVQGYCPTCDMGCFVGPPGGLGCGGCADPKARRSLNWVIVGGESGPGARPMHPAWARSLRDQCAAAGVPFFFKQWGDIRENGCGLPESDYYRAGLRVGQKKGGRILDGRTWDEFPATSEGTT